MGVGRIWLIGPILTSTVLLGVSVALSNRFAVGQPVARGIPADFIGWLVFGATLVVAFSWVVSWMQTAASRWQPFDPVATTTAWARRTDLITSRQSRLPGATLEASPDATSARLASEWKFGPTGPGLLRLRNCLVWSVALNLPFIVTGQVWHSYDFSTHVFLASHYQRDWWSLWEPRWFEGFDVASYPPLTHQLAALLGWIVGTETAVSLLTGASVVAFPFVLRVFARQYLASTGAAHVAALAIVTPSIFLAGYAFGQLPTLFALNTSLIAAVALRLFLRHGHIWQLATALALAGVVAATHHATLIFFLPPLFGTVILFELLRADARLVELTRRAILAAVGTALVGFAVILPFWFWYATERVAQLPIDHQSRHNLLLDPVAQDEFFWAIHGILVAGVLVALPLLRRQPRTFVPWYLLAAYLLMLGLGGTTPAPRLLFGSFWEWLTYDRFSIWADIPVVVLLGATTAAVTSRLTRRTAGRGHESNTSDGRIGHAVVPTKLAGAAWLLTIGLLATVACTDALLPTLIQAEPVPIDLQPIVAFLDHNGRDVTGKASWRYLTLGFGDQAGLLEARTDLGTPDGYFFTARRTSLLTQSRIASLDYSLLWDPSARSLRELLLQPGTAHVRWAFTEDPGYETILVASGWRQTERLTNGIGVWETKQNVAPVEPTGGETGILAIWWGLVPLGTLATAVALLSRSELAGRE